MRRRRSSAAAANPVLIGAVTTLVIVVAVFLAYNANKGLPFVPTFELRVDVPDAARLVVGNDVREGGFRIGQVADVKPIRKSDGTTGAELTLKVDKVASPVPADSTVVIRPRSALGLKYVELVRGKSRQELAEGSTLTATEQAIGPELDEFLSIFDDRTRENTRSAIDYFGDAVAGRGPALNRTLEALPGLLGDLRPVMRTLRNPDTGLVSALEELNHATRITRPVAGDLAEGFTGMANTFEGLSVDGGRALRETIARSPATLSEGIRSLPVARPLLAELADVSDELAGSARALRAGLPTFNRALAAGIPVLRRTPRLSEDLETALRGARDLARSPTTDITLSGLSTTMGTLAPTLRYVGPFVTVCNYFNYFWTLLSDHISEEDTTGTIQRIQVKNAPVAQPNSLASFGAARPATAPPVEADPVTKDVFGDYVDLHAQNFPRAVDESGNADCESGQRGYPTRLASGFPEQMNIAVDPRTPGSQGPTFTGRPRVPAGQTYAAEPTGLATGLVKVR